MASVREFAFRTLSYFALYCFCLFISVSSSGEASQLLVAKGVANLHKFILKIQLQFNVENCICQCGSFWLFLNDLRSHSETRLNLVYCATWFFSHKMLSSWIYERSNLIFFSRLFSTDADLLQFNAIIQILSLHSFHTFSRLLMSSKFLIYIFYFSMFNSLQLDFSWRLLFAFMFYVNLKSICNDTSHYKHVFTIL